MRYIALEEAFSIPGLGTPLRQMPLRPKKEYAESWQTKLADFTEYRLPEMDAAGIDIQVLSLTVPGLQIDIDEGDARERARSANDYLAHVISEHPKRFRGFAALPLQDPRAAARELERCVTELGFCGALVNDHLGGHYLDEPQYDDVWAAVESLKVPLYLHPGAPPADRWHVLEGHPEMCGALGSWGAEVAAHALRIVFGGVFGRHPAATLILGHMGEFLPSAQQIRLAVSDAGNRPCTAASTFGLRRHQYRLHQQRRVLTGRADRCCLRGRCGRRDVLGGLPVRVVEGCG